MALRPVERAFTVPQPTCAPRQRPAAAPNKHLTAGRRREGSRASGRRSRASGSLRSSGRRRRWRGHVTARRARRLARRGARRWGSHDGRRCRRRRGVGARRHGGEQGEGKEQSSDHASPRGVGDRRASAAGRSSSAAGVGRYVELAMTCPVSRAARPCTSIAGPLQISRRRCVRAPPSTSAEPVQEGCYKPGRNEVGARHGRAATLCPTAAPRDSDGEAGRQSSSSRGHEQ
jgi:hypothetical protein